MSEHPPQNQNIDKTPKFSMERTPYSAEDESLAHYIHSETGGKGASSEHINELIDDANEKIYAKRGAVAQEKAAESARLDVEKALNDQEPDAENGDNETDSDFEGNDDETKLMDQFAEKDETTPRSDLTPEQLERIKVIQDEIDAIDKIHNYDDRRKKLEEYALRNNGEIAPDGKDIGVEAAKRLNKSKARSIFNPKRYTIRFGKSRRHHNTLLAKMSERGPNLEAAKAMKWNWDPRYRKIVPAKNETLYKVSEIFEKQITDLPEEMHKLRLEIETLENKENKDEIEINKKKGKLIESQKQYQIAVEQAPLVDKAIDPLYSHSHKYRGEIIANRAVQRDDIDLLKPLDTIGHKRKRQQAIADIVVARYRKLNDQEKDRSKRGYIEYINKNIKNKSIKGKAISSIV